MTEVDLEKLRKWLGRTESRSERLGSAPANLLRATLDVDAPETLPGMELAPLFHWLYFLPVCRQSNIGSDGHPARGGLLPPIPLPRRMWASSEIEFAAPLIIGEVATRASEILDITQKKGRSGPLVFVQIRHVVSNSAGSTAITEIQNIVYRDHPASGEPLPRPDVAPALPSARWQKRIEPDPTLLFRYSALTFNAHRIHYDRPYAVSVEGYPAPVVHGPLVATMMVHHLLHELPGARLRHFEFRAEKPLFCGSPFFLNIEPTEDAAQFRLWSHDPTGERCTRASASLHTSVS